MNKNEKIYSMAVDGRKTMERHTATNQKSAKAID